MTTLTKHITLDDFPLTSTRNTEVSILAGLMYSPEYLPEVRNILSLDMFSEEMKEVWNIIVEMEGEEAISPLTVTNKLKNKELTKELITCTSIPYSLFPMMTLAAQLRAASIRRLCYQSAVDMLKKSVDPMTEEAELMQIPRDLEESIKASISLQQSAKRLSEVFKSLGETLEEIEIDSKAGKQNRVPSGIKTLDYINYGGFGRGHLVILAARPGVGKTALALHMAKKSAAAGHPVQFFSIEMPDEELAQRYLFATGEMTPTDLARGQIHWKGFERAVAQYEKLDIYIDQSTRTLSGITSKIILAHQQGRCDIVFIDYLQLIKVLGFKGGERDDLRIGEITGELKAVAKECKIPIILLCQLNRESVKDGRSPELQDLRGSGSIEQDADQVLMVEAAKEEKLIELLNENADKFNPTRSILLWIRKNRHGKKGNDFIPLEADETYNNFKELDEKLQPAPIAPMIPNIEDDLPF